MTFFISFGRNSSNSYTIMAKSSKKPSRSQAKSAKKTSSKASAQPKKAAEAPKPLSTGRSIGYHIGIVVAFLALLFMYFSPIMSGKVIKQGDITNFNGQAREVRDFNKATGDHTTWTNVQFSGMPAYHMGTKYPGNLMMDVKALSFLGLPNPIKFLFLIFVGFYILMLSFNMGHWVSALGAFAFTFSSYFFIIQAAGHTSKAAALCYMAPMIAGVLWAYRGKVLLGSVVTALALALNLASNHFQITYYMAITVGVIGAAFLVDAIMKKTLPDFAKTTGMLMIAAALAVGPSLSLIWTSAEYAEDTTRGPRELKAEPGEPTGSGLDYEYAMRWSYGISETFTLMIPAFSGGSSTNRFDPNHEVARQFRDPQRPSNDVILPTYWGDQPFTSGPVYVGAIICFLFILGLFVVEGPMKWWLLAATIVSFILAWGRHMGAFNEFIYNALPAYNKFRAPAMTLVIAQLTMPLLGMLALHRIFNRSKYDLKPENIAKYILLAGGITGGLALFMWLLGGEIFPFTGRGDARYQPQAVDIFKDLRIDMMKMDALRAFGLIAVSTGLLWMYVKNRVKWPIVIGILLALSLADMWNVNKRYMGDEAFVEKRQVAKPQPSRADQQILQDQDPYYRVFNATGVDPQNRSSWEGPFNESQTAYFHNAVGGYHAAKLRRYQDMISKHIQLEMVQAVAPFYSNAPDSVKQQTLANLDVLNMLNTKYFILNPNQPAIRNPYNMGNAWFVSGLRKVKGPDAEIAAVGEIDPRTEAVIDEDKFGSFVEGFTPSEDPSATISLTSYAPNKLVYQATTSKEMLSVFSDVYYNGGTKGWNMYINGEKTPHFRVNYILRAARIPAGTSTIEFRMEPRSYQVGEAISLISSIILILAALGIIFMEVKKNYDKTQRKSE